MEKLPLKQHLKKCLKVLKDIQIQGQIDKMSEEKKKITVDMQQFAEMTKNIVSQVIAQAQGNQSEWSLANAPFERQTKEQKQAEKCGSLILRPKSEVNAKKELTGFKTGTFIDQLFLNEKDKPLGGIPVVAQLGLTGLAGCGKSILVQEIALRCANEGKRVIFTTSEDVWESPSLRQDLQSRMKRKAEIMGLDWETIRNNLFVLDAIQNSSLRDWSTFVETFRYLVEILEGIDLLIIDSITLMQAYRGSLKYRVMELSRYCQLHGITTIYVCQRAEDEADKLNVAGGIGLSHNLDIMMCVDKKKAVSLLKFDLNQNRPKDNQLKQWAECHFVRVLACRLCQHDATYHEIFVTKDGFLRIATFIKDEIISN